MTRPRSARKTATTCPRCGSAAVAEIQYGLPAFSDDLEKELDARRIVLGGCEVWPDRPDRACTSCRLEFRSDGRPPATLDEVRRA